jgi:uncharacterized protein
VPGRRTLLGGIAAGLLAVALSAATVPDASLASLAERGDWDAVGRAAKPGGPAIDAPGPDGMTALHWAVYHDRLDAARALLAAGANPGARNRYGVAPLSTACENANPEMVELLLESGADPNTARQGGETVLMTAARAGRVEPVRALLARGAKVEATLEGGGQDALMWAAAEGHAGVVRTLVEAGADFRRRVDSGFTAFLFAVREGRPAAVRALLDAGADPNETIEPPAGFAPRRGPRPGTGALALAVRNAHFELAAALLDAGADPNAVETGATVLHIVTGVRKPGTGDNDPAPEGSGAMSSLEFVERAVAAGADPNARMTKPVNIGDSRLRTMGATPFFMAARSADAEYMRKLVELGADPHIPNDENTTALLAAAGLGTRSPGEDAGTEDEVLAALEYCLELGFEIDHVDDKGETAMHGAAYKNLPRVVELLAARGANVEIWNRKNKHGWSPLAIASGYRFGNFKPSDVTIAAFRRVMEAAGVPFEFEVPAPEQGYRP